MASSPLRSLPQRCVTVATWLASWNALESNTTFGNMEEDLRRLGLLGEESARLLKQIAEVQSHHGTVLEQHSQLLNQIVKDIEPLKVLPDLVRPLVQDHERRIAALEKRDT
jgi:hypothetical protein